MQQYTSAQPMEADLYSRRNQSIQAFALFSSEKRRNCNDSICKNEELDEKTENENNKFY